MSGQEWYVLHSKPHKENQLNAFLQSQEIETFYPTLHVKPVNPRASKIRPYFPRYLFVHVDLDDVGVSALKWAPGAVRLIEFGGHPATVPYHLIYELKQRLARIEAAGGLHLDGLEHGDPVRIVDGPFAGYEAIFDTRLSGTERVRVLLDMVGRKVFATLNHNAIEKQRGH
jgi:transcription elongation factor/antiterminator RfaH